MRKRITDCHLLEYSDFYKHVLLQVQSAQTVLDSCLFLISLSFQFLLSPVSPSEIHQNFLINTLTVY